MFFLVPSVAGYSFGALTPESSKTADRNVSFRIGLINPGSERLNINFESTGLENGEVVFPDGLSLPPSEISSSPREGWISVGPNRYVKPRWISFYVLTEDSSDTSFSVQAEARRPVLTSDESVSPRIVQVREFSYSLSYPEERFSQDQPEEMPKTDVFSFGNEKKAEENKSAKPNQTMIFGKTGEETLESSRDALPTLLMAAIATASVFYLWRSL